MDKQPVGQLPDLTQSNNDDEIMVITNSEYNQLKKEKISDLITDFISTNEDNALIKGTDGKMFVTDFGNAANITDGTLPTSVLPEIPLEKIPDIPKDKLPQIEIADLPVSGVTAGEYIYPTNMQVNSKGQIISVENGVTADITKEQIDTVAARPLSDNACTQENFPDEYAYWVEQAHSTFDLSKFEVVGSPTISEDGVASGFSASTNYLYKQINLANQNFILNFDISIGEVINTECFMSYETNYTSPATNLFRFQYSSGQRYLVIGNSPYNAFLPMDANKKYKFSLQYNVVTKIFTLLQYDYNNILINTWSSPPIDFKENGYLIIGNSINANVGTSCSIDLKSIAAWSDGQPVFSGNKTGIDTINDTLEIPYTESTDGTKIVDAAYLDRVQDCYEQTGQALYLTLDEQNQAYYLPQGTVSGMISRNLSSIQNNLKDIENLNNSKADVDMTNVSTKGKTNISSFDALDINNVIVLNPTIEADTAITIPYTGWLHIRLTAQLKTSGSEGVLYVKLVDGEKTINAATIRAIALYSIHSDVFVKVKKGCKLYLSIVGALIYNASFFNLYPFEEVS